MVYAGPLARPLVWRVNFPGGKFWVVDGIWVSVFCLAAKFLFFGFWAAGAALSWVLCWGVFVGALVRSELVGDGLLG